MSYFSSHDFDVDESSVFTATKPRGFGQSLAVSDKNISVRTTCFEALSKQDYAKWKMLSANAVKSSIFAEPWFMASVLQNFHKESDTTLFIVERVDGGWLGVIALSQEAKLGRIPGRHWMSVVNANQFLGVPLVRAGYETVFWRHLLTKLDNMDTARFALTCKYMPGDDPVTEALVNLCLQQSRSIETLRAWERAVLIPKGDFANLLPAKKRGRIASLKRKLTQDHGAPILKEWNGKGNIERWIEDFFELEQSGWKGRQNSAMACSAATKALFRDTITASAASGQLRFIAMQVCGKPVAMSAFFISGGYGFGFKSAYDEAFAPYAPGILLLEEVSRILHDVQGMYFDSCSAPGQKPLEDFWSDRRQISDLCVALGSSHYRTKFSAIITIRRLWHKLKTARARAKSVI